MKLEANQRFYSNNWSDFVHLQYLIDALKLVPNVITENNKQQTVDEYKITTDKNGENPIEIIGTDSEGNQTRIHLKPEITERVNELIRDNIHVLINDTDQEWSDIKLVKNTDLNCFEVSAKLKNGSIVNTIIPDMSTDDLKQINTIRAYPNKIIIKFLEENAEGQIEEKERVYDFDLYVTKEEYNEKIKEIDDKLANVGEIHQLSDKACSYDCINHGKIGYCVIYNLGETQHMLLNFDADFQGCLNGSLKEGEEWIVTCHPIDLTTNEEYTEQREWQPCTVEMVYHSGERILLEAQCNITQVKFTVPTDAVRDNIAHCWLKGILYFE